MPNLMAGTARRPLWKRAEFWVGIMAAPSPLWGRLLLWAIERAGDVDFLISLWVRVQPFLLAHWDIALMVVGFGLVAHAIWRDRKSRTIADLPTQADITPPAPAPEPPAAQIEPAASQESVLYLRIVYNDYFGRAFTLAVDIFYADLLERLRPFTRHLITEYVLQRLTANKGELEAKLRGTGGFTQADFTDSVLMLFRKTMLDYVTFVGVIKNAGREIVGDELLLRQSWYAQLYGRHAAAVQKLKEVRYHPDLAWTVQLILPMLDDLVLPPSKDAAKE